MTKTFFAAGSQIHKGESGPRVGNYLATVEEIQLAVRPQFGPRGGLIGYAADANFLGYRQSLRTTEKAASEDLPALEKFIASRPNIFPTRAEADARALELASERSRGKRK